MLIPVGLSLSTLVWTPTMLPLPFACTAKLVLERIEVFVMDATLLVPFTLTPPTLPKMYESVMKACPPLVLLATLTPFCVKW